MKYTKSCPFCGEPAEVKTSRALLFSSWCECTSCHAKSMVFNSYLSEKSERKAILAWNKRPEIKKDYSTARKWAAFAALCFLAFICVM